MLALHPAPQRFAGAEPAPRTVLIIGPNDLAWGALHATLVETAGVAVVGYASHPETALQLAASQPELMIAATRLREGSSAPLIAAVRQRCPDGRLVIIADALDIEESEAFARLGAAGYLLWRDLDLTTLRSCLDAVAAGHALVGCGVRGVVEAERTPVVGIVDGVALDARARAVLAGLAMGRTQGAIARELGVSQRTVERWIASLMLQLDAPSLYVLGMRVAELGLVRAANRCRKPDDGVLRLAVTEASLAS